MISKEVVGKDVGMSEKRNTHKIWRKMRGKDRTLENTYISG